MDRPINYKETIVGARKWDLGGAPGFPVPCNKCGTEVWVRETTRPIYDLGIEVLCLACTLPQIAEQRARGEIIDHFGPDDPRRKAMERPQ